MYVKGPALSPETVVLGWPLFFHCVPSPRLPASVKLPLCELGAVFLLRFKSFLEQVSLLTLSSCHPCGDGGTDSLDPASRLAFLLRGFSEIESFPEISSLFDSTLFSS